MKDDQPQTQNEQPDSARGVQLSSLPSPDAQNGPAAVIKPNKPGDLGWLDPPLPKIPSRDTALRRTVREWLEKRPDLRDDQYVDLLMLKVRLRRHAAKIATQLQGGVLEKGSGQPKKALDAQLQIARAMMQIDDMLPKPPSPTDAAQRVVRIIVGGRCPQCSCSDCEAVRGVEAPPVSDDDVLTDDEVIKSVRQLAEQIGGAAEDSDQVIDRIIETAERSARGESETYDLGEGEAREMAREMEHLGAKVVPVRRSEQKRS